MARPSPPAIIPYPLPIPSIATWLALLTLQLTRPVGSGITAPSLARCRLGSQLGSRGVTACAIRSVLGATLGVCCRILLGIHLPVPPCSLAYPHTFHRLGCHSMQRASRHSHRRQWEVVWPPLVEWVDGCTSTPITHSGNLMLADGRQYGCPPVAVR